MPPKSDATHPSAARHQLLLTRPSAFPDASAASLREWAGRRDRACRDALAMP